MSYDLYFRSRSPGGSLSWDDFVGWFDDRPHHEIHGSQACYENEDTGVYFSWEHGPPFDEEEAEEAGPEVASLLPVAFNMNYYRPHVFGLEAAAEISAFVAHFDLTVSDPQNEGMGDGPFTEDGFLRGWNAGNEFACRAIMGNDEVKPPLTLPKARIRACWEWNHIRDDVQNQLGESVFVPRIMFIVEAGFVQTVVAWIDGIPALLPEVDRIIVVREETLPRKLFKPRQSDLVVFTWLELAPLLSYFRRVPGPVDAYELFYTARPAEMTRAIKRQPRPERDPEGLSFDQILDEELVTAQMAAG